jgi:NhaP-type Na+/H+ and K+/H+ antiporter
MPLLAAAATAIFSTAHIAATAGITGCVALAGCLLVFGLRGGLAEGVAIGVLSAGAVFLWRKSANMPQLNKDGLSPFSANDWLAPMLVYIVLGMYATVRRPSNDRRFGQARALAVLAAFIVNVVAI